MEKFLIILSVLVMLVSLIFGTFSVVMVVSGTYIGINIAAIVCHIVAFVFSSMFLVKYNFMEDLNG